MSAPIDVRKLDADLAGLLTEGRFAPDADFPVMVSAAPDCLAEVRALVEARGQLRHQLTALGVVSAWLPLAVLPELASFASVVGLELAQPMRVACRDA